LTAFPQKQKAKTGFWFRFLDFFITKAKNRVFGLSRRVELENATKKWRCFYLGPLFGLWPARTDTGVIGSFCFGGLLPLAGC
jgi:hypothetical protein